MRPESVGQTRPVLRPFKGKIIYFEEQKNRYFLRICFFVHVRQLDHMELVFGAMAYLNGLYFI